MEDEDQAVSIVKFVGLKFNIKQTYINKLIDETKKTNELRKTSLKNDALI